MINESRFKKVPSHLTERTSLLTQVTTDTLFRGTYELTSINALRTNASFYSIPIIDSMSLRLWLTAFCTKKILFIRFEDWGISSLGA